MFKDAPVVKPRSQAKPPLSGVLGLAGSLCLLVFALLRFTALPTANRSETGSQARSQAGNEGATTDLAVHCDRAIVALARGQDGRAEAELETILATPLHLSYDVTRPGHGRVTPVTCGTLAAHLLSRARQRARAGDPAGAQRMRAYCRRLTVAVGAAATAAATATTATATVATAGGAAPGRAEVEQFATTTRLVDRDLTDRERGDRERAGQRAGQPAERPLPAVRWGRRRGKGGRLP